MNGELARAVDELKIIYTPEELGEMRETSAFINYALERGRVLYAV